MKYYEGFINEMDTTYNTPAVGDTVYIKYKNTQTPVKIIEIKKLDNDIIYIVSHNIELSEFKNDPDTSVRSFDIIGPYKGISTPAGYGWVAKNPNINTGVFQVSNDMYL